MLNEFIKIFLKNRHAYWFAKPERKILVRYHENKSLF